jgi:hypothetical protein
MSSSSDTAGAKAVVAAANQKGGQLTSAETAAVLSGVDRSGGGSSYNSYSNPSDADLYGSNFHGNYITGNALWTDPRVNNAQRSMIQSNYYAQQAGNASPYSQDQIKGAAGGGYAGYSYAPGNMGDRYSYVQPYQTGGQNWISPTQRTDQDGNTVVYRGYANEPGLGAYAKGTQTPQDMNYSWERTGGYDDLRAGTFQFNPEGAAAAAARDITMPLFPGDTGSYAKNPDWVGNKFGNVQWNPDRTITADGKTLREGVDFTIKDNRAYMLPNSYALNPDWVGNVFPGAQWNEASRTINVGDGRVLREGTDFVIKDNRAYVLPGVSANTTPNLTPAPTTTTAPTGVPNTGNEWHNLWRDMQNQYAGAMPAFNPPAREDFRFTGPVFNISSSGDDVHIPTLAAKRQWEEQQNAIQDQYAKQYGVNYQRAQDIYNTQLDWLKAGMLEQQRQEEIAREAARYQAETALKLEQEKYNRAMDMWNAGVATPEIYRTLGIPEGSKPFDQFMSEQKMKLAEMEYALSVSKAASRGSGGGGGGGGGSSSGSADFPYYLDTQGERANVMTGSLMERADAQYQLNKQRGGSAGDYPLYYTLNTLFNNSDWRKASTSSGADVKAVADYLITKYAKMSPEDYFNTGKASGTSVAAAYKQLLTQAQKDTMWGGVTSG